MKKKYKTFTSEEHIGASADEGAKTAAKKAFTLAEVLITLTIIGVVAALTIPTLVQKTNKQEYVSALQKAYSTLSQATNRIIAEEGSPKAADGGWADTAEHVYQLYKKYLNNARECGSEGGCLEQGAYQYLDKSGTYQFENTNWRRLILADGVNVMFLTDSRFVNCTYNSGCGTVRVDVNGAKKPNTAGRDVFLFAITEQGLQPYGCTDNSPNCVKADGSFGNGTDCACKVLREGRMDY